MWKRILIGLVVIAAAAFCVIYLIRHEFTSPGKKSEAAARRSVTQVVSSDLVQKNSASDTWDQELCQGQPARLTPVLTMELEKVWLTDRPILFVGKIVDIKTEDKDNDRLIIDRDAFWAATLSRPLLKAALRISVLCPKATVDSFVAANPDYLDPANGIAVVAKIEAVETAAEAPGGAGGPGPVKIGQGRCVDLMCLRKR
jgi:hypothetical protein